MAALPNVQEYSMILKSDTRSKGRYGVITCAEPGCVKQIVYYSGDKEIPLYCERHRTEEGRHSATRKLG